MQENRERECQDTVDVSAFLSPCMAARRRGKMLTLPLSTGRQPARERASEQKRDEAEGGEADGEGPEKHSPL